MELSGKTASVGVTRPASVTGAAVMFGVFGAATVANAIVASGELGWSDAADLGRTLLRLAACGLVIWGLLRRERWAWWLAVAFAVLWLVGGALTLAVVEDGDLHWLPPSRSQLFASLGMLSLAAALGLLATPAARRHLRER
jgi:hypothetical protein